MAESGSEMGAGAELPQEMAPGEKKRPWGKILAVIVVVIVIIAAIAAWYLLTPPANRAPAISQATASTEVAQVGETITFTAQASDPDGDAVSYAWNFGDGGTGTTASTSHSYTLSGRYITLLTVSDGKGGVATNDAKLIFLTVNLAPAAVAEPSPCPSGVTAETGFSAVTKWSYSPWEGGTNSTGARLASGGNTGAFVNITTSFVATMPVSGYYYQKFTYDGTTPLAARLRLDRNVTSFGATGGNTTAYAFVDTNSAAPTLGTQVWSSGLQTATTTWASVTPPVDVGSKLSAAGDYYLKIAVRTQNGALGSNTSVGFDNVQLSWAKSSGCPAGPVVPILSADKTTTSTGTAITFNSNASWAWAFAWNDASDRSLGGAYSLTIAADDPTLFNSVRYEWGDGTANTTGTTTAVGKATHTFTIDALNIDETLSPGKEATVTLTPTKDGTLEFYCRFHKVSNGMVGTLKVGTGSASSQGGEPSSTKTSSGYGSGY